MLTQNPVADGYVRDGSFATTNFGTGTSLIVKKVTYGGYTRQVYLKFDLTALTPAYDHATLRLFGSRDPGTVITTSTTESVYGVLNDSWTETVLNWNGRPAPGAVLSSATVSGKTGKWYQWDVSSFVLARKAAGSKFATLAVVMQQPPGGDESYDVFNSREASTNKPQLVFSPVTAPSAPGPTSSPSPSPSATPASSSTVVLNAVGDSYVRDGSLADANYGSESTLLVKNVAYPGYTRQVFLKFNVSSLPSSFQQVVLRVYGSRVQGPDATTPTTESVFGVANSAWDEQALDWNGKPTLGDKLDTVTVTDQTARWYEWDVTGFIAAQKAAGKTTASLAVVMDTPPANDEGFDTFQSRESANAPKLVVSLNAGSVVTPTPAPTATPAATPAPTATPRATPATTPVATATPRPTSTPVATPIPTATPSATPIGTPTPTTPAAQGTDFYIDSSSGNDGNSGLSSSSAWKTLAPVNATTFDAGDRILFRSGTRYSGHLELQGSGSATAPIIVSNYGTGALPAIDGKGLSETLLLQNEQYWEISNLEITNTGASPAAGRNGVLVRMQDYGVAHHIVLKNLYIHDVNGSLVKGAGGGQAIYLVVAGLAKKSRFDDLQVRNCRIIHCDRTGINMYNDYCSRDAWNPSLRVVIDGNYLEDIGGDGIVVIGCDGALVQHNVLKGGRTRSTDAAAGIWPWSSDNTVLQFNEVSGMVGTADGQAFDCDYNCQGTIFQYNYSHDNDGGFMLLINAGNQPMPENIGNQSSIVRYNISQNDGCRSVQIIGPVKNAQIYNNVIYTAATESQIYAVRYDAWGAGVPTNIKFSNNIFHGMTNNIFRWNNWTPATFSHNCFYGIFENVPADDAPVTKDPLFVSPGKGGSGIGTLSGYKLKDTSLCIGAGGMVANNGGEDFWGFGVDQITRPSIGVDNN